MFDFDSINMDNSKPENRVNYEDLVCARSGWCYRDPQEWPYWVGGNKDFLDQGQQYTKLYELRHACMLEF